MPGHSRDQNWQCHRCGVINTIGVNYECGGCRANAPIPPAVMHNRASAAPALTNQEVEKAQQELLRSVREMGHVS